MTSPYLEKPLRSREEAERDLMNSYAARIMDEVIGKLSFDNEDQRNREECLDSIWRGLPKAEAYLKAAHRLVEDSLAELEDLPTNYTTEIESAAASLDDAIIDVQSMIKNGIDL